MVDESLCKGCKICQVENACPLKDAKVEEVNGERKLKIDKAVCNHCGRCIGKCPFGAVREAETGCRVYIGGRWGKKVAHGIPLTKIFTSEEEVIDVVERAILLFRDEGISGERFADTVNRLGFDYVNEKLLSGAIDKAAVLPEEGEGRGNRADGEITEFRNRYKAVMSPCTVGKDRSWENGLSFLKYC